MKILQLIKAIETGITKAICKAVLFKDAFKVKLNDCVQNKQSTNYNKRVHYSRLLATLAITLFAISAILYPEDVLAAIDVIKDTKALAKKVQTETQEVGIPILLNAAGIACAGFAIVTQRWTMLILGAAYLVFVNVFFGFVNGAFKIS